MGNFSTALRVDKKTKVEIDDFVKQKVKPNEIDFVRETTDSSINFELSDWSTYENDFRAGIFKEGKFPPLGLTPSNLDYVFDCFKQHVPINYAIANFKVETQQTKQRSRANREKSPFDR